MPDVHGQLATDRPERYARQLASHWAAKTEQSQVDGITTLRFDAGRTVGLEPQDGVLLVTVTAAEEDVDRFAEVVAEHLQRFGQRDELQVVWS